MQRIIILDFGSQTTQLIARRVRELDTFCEIMLPADYPVGHDDGHDEDVIGVILSGSPCSVTDKNAPKADIGRFAGRVPVLGICFGAQRIAADGGGEVIRTGAHEYGRAHLTTIDASDPLFHDIMPDTQVWMSHGDTIAALPKGAQVVASTGDVAIAAFSVAEQRIWGVQFHPVVIHTVDGRTLLKNFVCGICGSRREWSADSFIPTAIREIREMVGSADRVVIGLSGGVDSSVCALLVSRAIGDRLTGIFVDHGLMRLGEADEVLEVYRSLGINVKRVDASARFFNDLSGVRDPERKRHIIGRDFVEVFSEEASRIGGARWLAQGTIYPDRIERRTANGTVIKSHHNVGGLPENMNLRLCEPLRWLFKDEVRAVGRQLGMPERLLGRHPFPGPGLAVRIVGEVTRETVRIVQEADDIFIRALRNHSTPDGRPLYDEVWQAGAVLLADVRTVGVMGDERTYDCPVVLRAVTSTDAMTADWACLPDDMMRDVSNEIINKVRGVNRVCYDISSKPPATIEWE